MPDTDGKMHLVDINSVDMDAEPAFNAPTDVIFHLFTRQNPTVPQNIGLRNDAQLVNSNFVATRQTRFYTHGRVILIKKKLKYAILIHRQSL